MLAAAAGGGGADGGGGPVGVHAGADGGRVALLAGVWASAEERMRCAAASRRRMRAECGSRTGHVLAT